jgi:hypothetical protein
MPAPHNVSHSKFTNQCILYNNGDFSVAIGTYTEANSTEEAIGMRWNGSPRAPAGYPHVVGNSVWFIVTPELARPILDALVSMSGADSERIEQARMRLP